MGPTVAPNREELLAAFAQPNWKLNKYGNPICWPIDYLNRAERRKRQFAKRDK